MTPPSPLPDQPDADLKQQAAVGRKSRSIKPFLFAHRTILVLSLGVISLATITLWVARNQLATTSLSAYLRSKGIPSDIVVENLQLDTALIRNLSLGSKTKPNLIAKNVRIKWRIDSKSRMVIIEQILIEDVKLHAAITSDGKLDLGAISPLLKTTPGPKRSVLKNVRLSNVTVLLDTPQGQASARLMAWGGEAEGWKGRADVTPPNSMILKSAGDTSSFVPIRLGFAIQQIPRQSINVGPALSIGFAFLPNGQSLTYQDYSIARLSGNIAGRILIKDNDEMRLDTRSGTLRADRFVGNNIEATGLNATTMPLFWTHETPWQTKGWGNIAVTGTLDRLKLSNPNLALGATRFRLGAARAQSGRMQVDYQGDVQNVSGTLVARRIVANGNVTTTLRDLNQMNKAQLLGNGQFSTLGVKLPADVKSALPSTLPPAIAKALAGTFSSSGSLQYQFAPSGSLISLAGPLVVTGSTGLRSSWLPDRQNASAIQIKKNAAGTAMMSGLGTGRVSFDLPGFWNVQGTIDGASFGPQGWAVIGRDVIAKTREVTPNLAADIMFNRFNLTGYQTGTVNGQGIGQIAFTANAADRALLDFNLQAAPNVITGTLQGPVEGFGSSLGGGYGIKRGNVRVTGAAKQRGQIWQVDARSLVTGAALTTNSIALVAPNLKMVAAGNIDSQGNVDGRVQLAGTARRSQPVSRRDPIALSGFDVNGAANLKGSLKNLKANGNFASTMGRVAINGASKGPSGPTILTGLRASGPFNLNATTGRDVGSNVGGRITFASTIGLSLNSIQAGTTRLTGVAISTPVTVTREANTMWRARGRLTGQADVAALGATTFTDLRLNGPFNAAAITGGWQSDAVIALTSQTLTSGQTRLVGLSANGPIGARSSQSGLLRISAPKCLTYVARSGTFPGDTSVGPVSGKLCPNAAGQIAVLGPSAPRLLATTQINPLVVQMGGPDGDQRIDIGEITGNFNTNPNGSLGLDMQASLLALNLKMPDGTIARISANNAALNIVPQSDGVGLIGNIGQISSTGLPVALSGSAKANLVSGTQGLAGTFNFDDIMMKDTEKTARFGDVKLAGSGTLSGNQIVVNSDVLEPASNLKLATLTLAHDIESGAGSLNLNAKDLLLSPVPVDNKLGVNIVTLIPPLRGVISDVVGVANASADFSWARSAPLISKANIATKGLDFSTLLGPVTGFTGDISLDDVFLVRTAGVQTIKIGQFDPGLPITEGVVQFALPGNNSLRLVDATWPFADGKLSIRPATWAFRDGDQSFAIDVENVDLAKLLRLTEVPNLEIDGRVSGVFPIEVREGNVEIVNGRLKAREGGGMIRYTGPNSATTPPLKGLRGSVQQSIFRSSAPAGADLAIEALRALEYKILEVTVNGRLTGELLVGVILEGANQQLLSGYPFKFNINMNVPVGQLLDNVDRLNNAGSSPEVLREIDRVLKEDADRSGAPPPPKVP